MAGLGKNSVSGFGRLVLLCLVLFSLLVSFVLSADVLSVLPPGGVVDGSGSTAGVHVVTMYVPPAGTPTNQNTPFVLNQLQYALFNNLGNPTKTFGRNKDVYYDLLSNGYGFYYLDNILLKAVGSSSTNINKSNANFTTSLSISTSLYPSFFCNQSFFSSGQHSGIDPGYITVFAGTNDFYSGRSGSAEWPLLTGGQLDSAQRKVLWDIVKVGEVFFDDSPANCSCGGFSWAPSGEGVSHGGGWSGFNRGMCCGDDALGEGGENLVNVTEKGSLALSSTRACCNSSTDCVMNDTVVFGSPTYQYPCFAKWSSGVALGLRSCEVRMAQPNFGQVYYDANCGIFVCNGSNKFVTPGQDAGVCKIALGIGADWDSDMGCCGYGVRNGDLSSSKKKLCINTDVGKGVSQASKGGVNWTVVGPSNVNIFGIYSVGPGTDMIFNGEKWVECSMWNPNTLLANASTVTVPRGSTDQFDEPVIGGSPASSTGVPNAQGEAVVSPDFFANLSFESGGSPVGVIPPSPYLPANVAPVFPGIFGGDLDTAGVLNSYQRFLCYRTNTKEKFFECCGGDLAKCNSGNLDTFPNQVRRLGEFPATVNEFRCKGGADKNIKNCVKLVAIKQGSVVEGQFKTFTLDADVSVDDYKIFVSDWSEFNNLEFFIFFSNTFDVYLTVRIVLVLRFWIICLLRILLLVGLIILFLLLGIGLLFL